MFKYHLFLYSYFHCISWTACHSGSFCIINTFCQGNGRHLYMQHENTSGNELIKSQTTCLTADSVSEAYFTHFSKCHMKVELYSILSPLNKPGFPLKFTMTSFLRHPLSNYSLLTVQCREHPRGYSKCVCVRVHTHVKKLPHYRPGQALSTPGG